MFYIYMKGVSSTKAYSIIFRDMALSFNDVTQSGLGLFLMDATYAWGNIHVLNANAPGIFVAVKWVNHFLYFIFLIFLIGINCMLIWFTVQYTKHLYGPHYKLRYKNEVTFFF